MLRFSCLLAVCLATVLLTGFAAPAETSLSLSDVLARHTAARGGAEALDRVKSAAIDLEIIEGGQTIHARYHAVADPKPMARVDIMAEGKRVYSEGMDSKGVWLWPGDEPKAKPSVAEGAANALLHGIESNLVGLHRFARRGHSLKLAPPEKIDGVVYQVVEVTYSTGHKTYFYIDPKTWLITRKRDERSYHPDAGQAKTRIESRFLDFQTVDGVVYSNKTEDYDLNTGKLISTNIVLKRMMNPPMPKRLFDRSYIPK